MEKASKICVGWRPRLRDKRFQEKRLPFLRREAGGAGEVERKDHSSLLLQVIPVPILT